MRFTIFFSGGAAILATLTSLPLGAAVPTTNNNALDLEKRQKIPSHINIGVQYPRDISDNRYWMAWVNGDNPCEHATSFGFTEGETSPCNYRFSVFGQDYQYSMQGCGGDLWLMRNGKENVGSCYSAPGEIGCSNGVPGFSGRWQCQLNDATG